MVVESLWRRTYGGKFVYTVHFFHRFLLHLHHNCTSGEGKERQSAFSRISKISIKCGLLPLSKN